MSLSPLDKKNPGYIAPLPKDQVTEFVVDYQPPQREGQSERGTRGRGRGTRGTRGFGSRGAPRGRGARGRGTRGGWQNTDYAPMIEDETKRTPTGQPRTERGRPNSGGYIPRGNRGNRGGAYQNNRPSRGTANTFHGNRNR